MNSKLSRPASVSPVGIWIFLISLLLIPVVGCGPSQGTVEIPDNPITMPDRTDAEVEAERAKINAAMNAAASAPAPPTPPARNENR